MTPPSGNRVDGGGGSRQENFLTEHLFVNVPHRCKLELLFWFGGRVSQTGFLSFSFRQLLVLSIYLFYWPRKKYAVFLVYTVLYSAHYSMILFSAVSMAFLILLEIAG